MNIFKEELVQAIANGNDSVDNILILQQNGLFVVVPVFEFSCDFQCVTRWETFYEGNCYVGKEASKDERHVEKIMEWAEIAWKKFQDTAQLNITNMMS
ncbi:hypothetical protein [Clostridium sp.]|uniref:hypothetical protein n=1 Tax=Clostridium sp. TaxID=1506 RepID=UPI003D6CB617